MRKPIKINRRALMSYGGVAAGAAASGPAFAQTYRTPGIYIEELSMRAPVIGEAATSIALFVDRFSNTAPENAISVCASFSDFVNYSGPDAAAQYPKAYRAMEAFFSHGGRKALLMNVDASDDAGAIPKFEDGLSVIAAEASVEFNLLYFPTAQHYLGAGAERLASLYGEALMLCRKHRTMLILDGPQSVAAISEWRNLIKVDNANAAAFAPSLISPAPESVAFGGGSVAAGIIARLDAARGVWKAPAGMETRLNSDVSLLAKPTSGDLAHWAAANINPFYNVNGANFIWGARTMTSDQEWKYIPVRRLALLIEDSLDRGLEWTVFEPNNEPLWTAVRTSVEGFLNSLFRQGAFAGAKADGAFFVRCDAATMTPIDQAEGRLIVDVGFAPLRPAEFIVLRMLLTAQSG